MSLASHIASSLSGSLWNGVLLLAQGGMQLSFLQRSTGQSLRRWLSLVYLCLLASGCYLASVLRCDSLAAATEYLALYALSCCLLAGQRSQNDRVNQTGQASLTNPVSSTAPASPVHPPRSVNVSRLSPLAGGALATLTAFVGQWSFGLLNPLLALLGPYVAGSRWLYALTGAATVVALGCCYGCFRLLAGIGSPDLPGRIARKSARQADWPLLLSVLFIGATERYLLVSAYGHTVTLPAPVEPGKQLLLLGLQLLGGGALFALLGGHGGYRIRDPRLVAEATVAALRQTLRLQAAYVAQAQQRYRQTRALRHDIKNHLTVLEGLLQREQLDQARAYLRQLTGVASETTAPVYTGHPVVDVLLHQKREAFAANGMEVRVSLALPYPCAVDDVSLCVLFANALDNAWQACCPQPLEKVSSPASPSSLSPPSPPSPLSPLSSPSSPSPPASPSASDSPAFFQIRGTQQGAFLLLEFVNPCRDSLPVSPGTGLGNIRAVAERYGGTMTVEKTAGQFCLRVLLRCS